MGSLNPLDLFRSRIKESDHKSTEQLYATYRLLAGSIMCAGNGSVPQASFIATYIHQTASRLRGRDLTESKKINNQRDLYPIFTFRKIDITAKDVEAWTFSYTSFNVSAKTDYGQTGIFIGIHARNQLQKNDFHIFDWSNFKQIRVSQSSYGVYIFHLRTQTTRVSTFNRHTGVLLEDKK